jgi:class 3 adenylate cyclase/tetratricopeptide (TPR) repeat protein
LTCPACGSPNEPGRKFCGECGAPLARTCPACGSLNGPTTRFCGECGTRLEASAGAAPGTPAAAVPAALGEPAPFGATGPQTELRLVSVLFADLVGFTSRAEAAEPEQVREFQARYFDACREVIERYGGTVEKFVGDAVMAVWGTPVAREDDAERAVRAALDLVDTIGHLGRQEGSELQQRVAVLTGEAAVAIGAVGQGMVAGDLVNTASRLQGVAPPGVVLVGEATKRAASSAIAFEPVGEQQLKGKVAPVEAWRALRIVAERGGQGRSEGIEAPFVGRDDELRLIKDFLHATSRERRVRLLSVTGQGGIGKSRLAWEFLKYIDGVREAIFWHQGRSPSFGEGVTFWALGEMVRRRAGLAETDDEATTRERIRATLEEYVPDEDERRRLEPALLFLLGAGEPPAGGREELFAAWRTFFERISLHGTTVLVFEDLQWADAGLLAFIDHLLEWSIGYPILVITLARPDLLERRPTWGAGHRNFVALALGPLPDEAMRRLLDGLVPGLPAPTIGIILKRADGIPLYAVETIRMLAEDGKLEEDAGFYRVVGDLGALQIPDTLHALIAARLDAVAPEDRALLQDGAVLGQTFSVGALAALTGEPPATLEPRLRALVQREILTLDTDPRSPERGQYGFTQALVREVAYSTLSKRDRRSRHLAAARYYESLDDDESVGVLAMHYVDAWEAAPAGAEGEAVGAQARIALRAAAERATALGSHDSAIAYWQRAAAATTDAAETAELLEHIGLANRLAGHFEAAEASLRAAHERYEALGDRIGAARAAFGIARLLVSSGRAQEALPLAEAAATGIADLPPGPVIVEGWLAMANGHSVLGRSHDVVVLADRALGEAERLRLAPQIVDGMATKGGAYLLIGRPVEGRALIESSLRLAEAIGLGQESARAAFTLALAQIDEDPRASLETSRKAVELCRRFGLATLRLGALMNATETSLVVGDWGWLETELEAVRRDDLEPPDQIALDVAMAEIGAVRGRDTSGPVHAIAEYAAARSDPQSIAACAIGLALVAFAEGRFEDAIRHAADTEADDLNAPWGRVIATRASVRSGDLVGARDALGRLEGGAPRGAASSIQRDALAAAVAALDGRVADAVTGFHDAWRRFRDRRLDVSLALSQLDYLSVAPAGDPAAVTAAREARTILEREGAHAYVTQLDALEAERERVAGTSLAHEVPAGARSSPAAS